MKKILFLDSNTMYKFENDEEGFQNFLNILSEDWEVFVLYITVLEIKLNQTPRGEKILKLFKYVKIVTDIIQQIPDIDKRQQVILMFQKSKIFETDNIDQYIEIQKYIELRNIIYIIMTINKIIEKYLGKEITYIDDNWNSFAGKYVDLNGSEEEGELLEEFFQGLKEYVNISDSNFLKCKEQVYKERFEEIKKEKMITAEEQILYLILYLKIVESILMENAKLKNKINDFYDLLFISKKYLNASILTEDKKMRNKFIKLGYLENEEKKEKIVNEFRKMEKFFILEPQEIKFSEWNEIYEKITKN